MEIISATRGAGQEHTAGKRVQDLPGGDSALFGDIKLIGEYYKLDFIDDPDRRSLPDESADAAFATKNYLKPKFVIPLHYATNPQHKGTPAEHIKALGQTSTKVIKISPGDSLEF